MKLSWVFRCNFLLVLFCALPLAAQPANLCGNPKSLPTGVRPCSFTGRNGDCTIVIDRLRPLSPPLINARRGAYIKVQIADPSPFEDLTFDLKSATSVVPVDPFSSAFTTLLGAAKTIEVIGVIGQRTPINSTEAQKISMQQSDLLTAIQASLDQFPAAMKLIIPATQPPPGNVCFKSKEDALPWIDLADWKTEAEAALDKVLTVTIGHNAPMAGPKDVKSQIYSIQYQIDNLRTTQLTPKDPSPNATADEKTQLTNGQKPLTDALALLNKVQALRKVVDGIIPKPEPTFTIVDLQAERTGKKVTKPIDKNDQNEQWQISFVNTFLQDVNSALADPVTDPITRAQNALKNASTPKTSVAAITANYQTAPGIEVSSGLMVPMQPYHSYASAEAATNGSVTGYVVQESLTYTVIPVAQLNFVAADWVAHRQRAAFFGTIAVGYNPATSSVEFGAGPSISWKSIVFSGLADIGRDTQLADGFTVGQSLGASSSAKPLTSTVWVLKPAVGISVRIPLGSSSVK